MILEDSRVAVRDGGPPPGERVRRPELSRVRAWRVFRGPRGRARRRARRRERHEERGDERRERDVRE